MQTVGIGSSHVHYALEGPADAPVMVLVNSLGTDVRLWDDLLPRIKGRWRFLRHDKRGHGLSGATDSAEPKIGDYASDVLALMDHGDVSEAVLCGVSIGGMIAQAAAVQAPDRFSALILADTGMKIGGPDLWNERIAQLKSSGLPAMADAIMERWFPEPFRLADAARLGLWRTMVARQDAVGYAAACCALRDADLTATTPEIAKPVLTLCGSEDQSTPTELVKALTEAIAGARYVEIAGAGHLPMIDKTADTAAAINDFLAENGLVR